MLEQPLKLVLVGKIDLDAPAPPLSRDTDTSPESHLQLVLGSPGVRIDTHAYAGYRVPPNYDSLLAKMIVHAPTRPIAISRARFALETFVVEGVQTTIPFLLELLQTPEFVAGDVDTKYVERRMASKVAAVV